MYAAVRTNTLQEILADISQRAKQADCFLIGIDGGGGAGKSTLAKEIASALPKVQVIHMDDFYKPRDMRTVKKLSEAPAGYEYDLQRLISQVLLPVSQGKTPAYQVYHWPTDRLIPGDTVTPQGILVVEGCYATIEQLRPYYHMTIFVTCPDSKRLARGLERDGQEAESSWKNWMEGEALYFQNQHPMERADFIYET